MPEIHYRKALTQKETQGTLVLFFSEGVKTLPSKCPAEAGPVVENLFALKDFEGKAGQIITVPFSGGFQRLICHGLGKPAELDREKIRRAAGSVGKTLAGLSGKTATVMLPDLKKNKSLSDSGEVLAEGLLLGGYQFKFYKEKPEEKKQELETIFMVDPDGHTSEKAMKNGVVRAEAISLARNLGNQPPNVATPEALAKKAEEIAKKHGMKCHVLEQKDMEKLGMGMLLGVAKGSRQPPKLIFLEHRPKGANKTLVLVGKGVTFDSGGISLKPGAAMDEMKFDMCGAAAVLGAMQGIGQTAPKVNVIGVVPACENLPDGDSLKPGDILKSYQGKHVEILNTDAEGRLILGDALTYAIEKYKPDGVVDLATLTGACVIALGHYATGAITNNDDLQQKVVAAGKSCGDPVWPLPNFPEYGEGLKGKYADLQNIGPREGGTISAGLFLKHFVGETP